MRKTLYGSEPTTTWFGGLLPEGANLEALAELCETEDKDPWTLFGIAGAECAGAVQIVRPEYRDAPAFEQIDDGTVAEMLKEYANNAPQRLLRAARLSLLAGAQYGKTSEKAGRTPCTNRKVAREPTHDWAPKRHHVRMNPICQASRHKWEQSSRKHGDEPLTRRNAKPQKGGLPRARG